MKLHGLQMWFVLIVHYDGDEDDDDDDRPYGDEGSLVMILRGLQTPLDEDDHLIKALLMMHHLLWHHWLRVCNYFYDEQGNDDDKTLPGASVPFEQRAEATWTKRRGGRGTRKAAVG